MRAILLPIIFTIVVIFTGSIPYIVAVTKNHVRAFLPFISDTGILIPERSIFSFFLAIAAFVHLATSFLRFEQVKLDLKSREEDSSKSNYKLLHKLNMFGLFIGCAIAFGLYLVANFQIPRSETLVGKGEEPTDEERIMQYVHWFGALLAFFGGAVWMTIHTIISIVLCFDSNKGTWRKKWAILRFLLTFASWGVLMAGAFSGVMGFTKYTGEEIWYAAALCEWLVTLIILVYIQTLCPQFVGIEISFFTVTSGHNHKACFPCCGNKKEEEIKGVSIRV